MKRMHKFVCILLVGCVIFTGCGNTGEKATNTVTDVQAEVSHENTEVGNTSTTETAEHAEEASSILGRIESIDGSTITLSAMGNMGGLPDGEVPSGQMPEGKAPNDDMQRSEGEAPNGDMQQPKGKAPSDDGSKPNGEAPRGESVTVTITDTTVITNNSDNTLTTADLSKGAMVTVTRDQDGNALKISISNMEKMMSMGGPGNSQGAPESYEAVNEYTEDTSISNEFFTSTGADENAILINGETVSLDNIALSRTSSDSTGGDNASFYGVGASILVTNGTVNITNSSIESDASGAAGVFAYGDGIANVSDTTITTVQNTSGGIHVAGGGTLHAANLTVETNGDSAAAIRSDRGGGTMTVDGGSYTSNGSGSPSVYCTADISINDAVLTATNSEAVCIEGLNSLLLTNCDLTGNMPDQGQNDCTWNVILYQSMSGDSEIGNSTFTMTSGTLTAQNGGMFYTTNTESTFYLSGVDITYADENDFFLKCAGNSNQRSWGTSGANGADCTFTADAQEMQGNIVWDSISTLEFTMSNGSCLTGAFVQDESAAGNGGNGFADLSIDDSSKWIVTENSVLSALSCKGTIKDLQGNTVTIQDADGNVLVKGTSEYTVTVQSYQA